MSEIDDIIKQLPEELQPQARDVAVIATRQGADWLTEYFGLVRNRAMNKAFKMLVKAQTPAELVAAQAADRPMLVQIALAGLADKAAQDAAVDAFLSALMKLAVAAILSAAPADPGDTTVVDSENVPINAPEPS